MRNDYLKVYNSVDDYGYIYFDLNLQKGNYFVEYDINCGDDNRNY